MKRIYFPLYNNTFHNFEAIHSPVYVVKKINLYPEYVIKRGTRGDMINSRFIPCIYGHAKNNKNKRSMT